MLEHLPGPNPTLQEPAQGLITFYTASPLIVQAAWSLAERQAVFSCQEGVWIWNNTSLKLQRIALVMRSTVLKNFRVGL